MRVPDVKRFEGKPDVYVLHEGNITEVTTSEHLRNEGKSLEEILRAVCKEAREYANKIFPNYGYPDGNWFPCGSADLVLRWNEHRDIINLFRKQADRTEKDGWYEGWFGRLFKTSQGWWWMPKLDSQSQSMLYEEDICKFVREKLIFANIKVDIRTYID